MKSTSTHDAPTDAGEAGESPLRFAVRAWDRFWFHPTDPTSLGLIRISTGILILYIHFVYSLGLLNYVGPNAWVSNKGVIHFLRYENPIQAPATNWKDSGWSESDGEILKGQMLWSIYYHVEDPTWVWVIHCSILFVMLLFTLGLWTRVTSVLTWIGALMYIQRVPSLLFGMDTMSNLALLYLMIAPCGAALSLDRWLKERRERQRLGAAYVPRPPEPMVSANFATRLIQINFCLIYFAAGTSKLLGASWWNGTAPNRFLLNYSFAPFEVGMYSQMLVFMAKHRMLWELFGAVGVIFTLFMELGLPFLIWNRHMRWVMVAGSVLFHTMIALLMGLVMFSLVMLCLVLAFVPPEAVRQGLQATGEQIRALLSSRTGRSEASRGAGPLMRPSEG